MLERGAQNDAAMALFDQIVDLNLQLYPLYGVKKSGVRLSDDDYSLLRSMESTKNGLILDMLLARTPSSGITVTLRKFEEELIHPFSMNRIAIESKNHKVSANLSDLRRKGVVEDSIKAEQILGDFVIEPEQPRWLLERTIQELIKIRDHRFDVARGRKNDYSQDELDDLTFSLVRDRIFVFGFLLDQEPVVFNGRIDGDRVEKIVLTKNGQEYWTYWHGQRLGSFL